MTRRMRCMHRVRLAAMVGIVAAGTSACAPKITKRYLTVAGTIGTGCVTLSGSAFPIEPAGPKTIFDLGPEGQGAAIAAYSAKAESVSNLQAAIAAPFTRAPGSGIQDVSTVSRRVVLSIDADHEGLADRLDACTVTLHLNATGPAKFKSWNQLTTKFETIDLGKLNYSQKGTFSAGLEGSAPGAGEIDKATLGVTAENSLAEEVLLRQRYVASSGMLTETDATIIQQGAVGIDLVGNVLIDLIVAARKTDVAILYRAENLLDAKGAPQAPGDVKVSRRYVRYPVNVTGGWATDAKGQCRRRGVTAGTETITESDDAVTYTHPSLTAANPIVLAAEDDLKVSKWVLMAGDDVLAIQEPDGANDLQFDSYDGARDFLLWLKATTHGAVNGRTIGFPALGSNSLTPLTPEARQDLRVEIMGVNWTPPEPRTTVPKPRPR